MPEEMTTQVQQMSLTVDWIALGISVLAIIVSVVTAVSQWKSSKRINDINLAAELSKEIFRDYLINKIPNAINQIYFPNNTLSGIEELQKVLNDLRKSMQFFLHIDKPFYEDLKEKCQGLETYLVKNENKVFLPVEVGTVMNTISSYIDGIYKLLNDKYING